MIKNFHQAIEARRSIYGISKENVLEKKQLVTLIEHAVKHTPSAFNSQSARVILLLSQEHNKFWDMVMNALREIVPPQSFDNTKQKIDSFAAGCGTVLFFEDQTIVENLQKQFPIYNDNFPIWSQQSNGMLQFVIWTALEVEGYGASLQHYNELVKNKISEVWDIPDSWQLIAQMPFGKATVTPSEKSFEPIENRFKVIGE